MVAAIAASLALALIGLKNGSDQDQRVSASADTDRAAEYFYYVMEVAPCIRALKFPVSPPPDLEGFLSQSPELAWSPFSAVEIRASAQEAAIVRSICHSNPHFHG
ncbi:MAG TPA: hypothetical protein VGP24_10545 [Glaciihabitans sp.]|jgi:hypothetical protein|nr:hypothetical protein [Glaciihabitans sp.]